VFDSEHLRPCSSGPMQSLAQLKRRASPGGALSAKARPLSQDLGEIFELPAVRS
jgi:hypothetical protein